MFAYSWNIWICWYIYQKKKKETTNIFPHGCSMFVSRFALFYVFEAIVRMPGMICHRGNEFDFRFRCALMAFCFIAINLTLDANTFGASTVTRIENVQFVIDFALKIACKQT